MAVLSYKGFLLDEWNRLEEALVAYDARRCADWMNARRPSYPNSRR